MSVSKSERFKIKDPLLQEFLSMINSDLKLNCVHARFTKKGNAWLYLSFESEMSQLKALTTLRRYTWRGRTLISTLVTADPVKTKSDTPYFEEDFSRKSQLNVPAIEQVLMSTIPYHSISYEEQLKKKSEEVFGLFKRFHNILKSKLFPHTHTQHSSPYYHQHIDPKTILRQDGRRKYGRHEYKNRPLESAALGTSLLSSWYEQKLRDRTSGSGPPSSNFPFVIEKVRASPIVDEYRNKVEFTVGINPDSNTLSVGPRIKSDASGRVQVGPIEGLRHLPPHVIRCVKEFEVFVRHSYEQNGGGEGAQIWKSIIIRTNFKKQLMLIFIADVPTGTRLQAGPEIPTKKRKVENDNHPPTGPVYPHLNRDNENEGTNQKSEETVKNTPDLPIEHSNTCDMNETGDSNICMIETGDRHTCCRERGGAKEDTHQIEQYKRSVIAFFNEEKRKKELNVVSMYFQLHKDRSALSFSKSDLIWGREYIVERLLNLNIAIAGGTYFRINSELSSVVLTFAIRTTAQNKIPTVILAYVEHCKKVIGIELLDQNIEDARRSASLNSIHNCTFIGGKLEDVLADVLDQLSTEEVVIILDPPRTGMIPELVRMLKRFRAAQRVIYICSNHKLPIKNLLDFCFNDENHAQITADSSKVTLREREEAPKEATASKVTLTHRAESKIEPTASKITLTHRAEPQITTDSSKVTKTQRTGAQIELAVEGTASKVSLTHRAEASKEATTSKFTKKVPVEYPPSKTTLRERDKESISSKEVPIDTSPSKITLGGGKKDQVGTSPPKVTLEGEYPRTYPSKCTVRGEEKNAKAGDTKVTLEGEDSREGTSKATLRPPTVGKGEPTKAGSSKKVLKEDQIRGGPTKVALRKEEEGLLKAGASKETLQRGRYDLIRTSSSKVPRVRGQKRKMSDVINKESMDVHDKRSDIFNRKADVIDNRNDKNISSRDSVEDDEQRKSAQVPKRNVMDVPEKSTGVSKRNMDVHNRSSESIEEIYDKAIDSIIIPEHIIPVDLSPHTLRTELVILCRRYERINETSTGKSRDRETPEQTQNLILEKESGAQTNETAPKKIKVNRNSRVETSNDHAYDNALIDGEYCDQFGKSKSLAHNSGHNKTNNKLDMDKEDEKSEEYEIKDECGEIDSEYNHAKIEQGPSKTRRSEFRSILEVRENSTKTIVIPTNTTVSTAQDEQIQDMCTRKKQYETSNKPERNTIEPSGNVWTSLTANTRQTTNERDIKTHYQKTRNYPYNAETERLRGKSTTRSDEGREGPRSREEKEESKEKEESEEKEDSKEKEELGGNISDDVASAGEESSITARGRLERNVQESLPRMSCDENRQVGGITSVVDEGKRMEEDGGEKFEEYEGKRIKEDGGRRIKDDEGERFKEGEGERIKEDGQKRIEVDERDRIVDEGERIKIDERAIIKKGGEVRIEESEVKTTDRQKEIEVDELKTRRDEGRSEPTNRRLAAKDGARLDNIASSEKVSLEGMHEAYCLERKGVPSETRTGSSVTPPTGPRTRSTKVARTKGILTDAPRTATQIEEINTRTMEGIPTNISRASTPTGITTNHPRTTKTMEAITQTIKRASNIPDSKGASTHTIHVSKSTAEESKAKTPKLWQLLTKTERGSQLMANLVEEVHQRDLNHGGPLECEKYIHPDAVKAIEERAFAKGLVMGVEKAGALSELIESIPD
ncbi:hypothetical protein M8J75_005420 [Diaphorina citri]|nr:hypothetical protein M8J75_005420 [Diaphorina citri]